MDFDRVEMGRRIAKRRIALHIKQNELAARVGYNNNHISSIEHGKITPSLELFIALCKELDVTPDYLLEGAMHSNNVPKNIFAKLNRCKEEDIDILTKIVDIFVDRAEGNS